MPGTTVIVPSGGSLNQSDLDITGAMTALRPKVPNEYFTDHFQGWAALPYTQQTSATAPTEAGALPLAGAGSGQLAFNTGAATTGASNLFYGYNTRWGLYSALRTRIGFWLPSLSVGGTQGYSLYLGAMQCAAAGPVPSSLPLFYLGYTDSLNGGRFFVGSQVPTNNLTAPGNMIDTTVAAAANTFYVLDFYVPINYQTATNLPVSWAIYTSGNSSPSGAGTANIGQASTLTNNCAAPLGAIISKQTGTTAATLVMDFWEYWGLY